MNKNELPNEDLPDINNVAQNIDSLVNSVEPEDLDIMKEYIQLPEDPDYETLSKFISHHGRGMVTNILEIVESARDKVGLSYKDFQQALLQKLEQI